MKSYKKSLDEVRSHSTSITDTVIVIFIRQNHLIEWPSSSKLAQLLCHVEKKFAKHIGPEEFVQCNPNLIKEQSNYDVPTTSLSCPPTSSASASLTNVAPEAKKKTCNLENYFEWSNRLRLLVANEILQVSVLVPLLHHPRRQR